MDSFELNKIVGALLGTVFVVFSVTLVADALFAAHSPETPGYAIEAAEEGGHGGPAVEEEAVSIAALLQDADPAKGEAVFRKCQACHTPDKGGANKVGPNLWGLVNRPIASHEGFAYSAPMREFAAGGQEVWDYEHLNGFLLNPKGYIKGTAMAFAGLKKDPERADLIAYLRTLADSPAPLPEAPAAETESAAAAEGDAATANEAAPATGSEPAEEAAPADGGEAAPAEESSN
ncbi:cytochrome c family protein [Mesorhizobium sp. Z1-4]|uniref:c-type cytochrome n=1 Tax=Mesorhizobium sp. Z1-4 TaxID=2448478 RepID=UPI000FD868B6|nr:cytochrome c family protein [Mesorhizobium sp. Z1-4]